MIPTEVKPISDPSRQPRVAGETHLRTRQPKPPCRFCREVREKVKGVVRGMARALALQKRG